MGTSPAVLFLVTALFLWLSIPVPGECKVYYACGAVLDSTENGLILSPGFPNNYLSGFHCVWQFFIPAGSRLQIETLDFDVFESPSDKEDQLSSMSSDITSVTAYKKVDMDAVRTESSLPFSSDSVTIHTTTEPFGYPSEVNRQVIVSRKSRDKNDKGEEPLLILQGFSAEKNILNQGTTRKETFPIASKSDDNLLKDSNKSVYPLTGGTLENNEGVTSSSPIMDIGTVPYTPQPQLVDVCPDDVLYISDLTRFSMRFCGSNSPLNKMLAFGSPVEMTEVIMELITTTNHGRGFAMLFSYQNQTAVTAMGVHESKGKEDIMLLAVMSATISFALVLLLVFCLSYR
ncbi:uncharacterized protein LOC128471388 [Spea bombifrons]|uniref:uncharacterized protein LOC128471388 n=1 Tax=Spea bombifrons TaxID=233779 RepID=UPI00234A0B90|nr:uncharacterized protein LOC128471388 [Spea bombifrons]